MPRKIVPELILEINGRLKDVSLAQEAITEKDARLLFTLTAACLVGIREAGGNNKGKWVEMIQDTAGRPMGQPWCMDYVQTCIAYAELKTGIKSPLLVTEGCDQLWTGTPAEQKVKFHPLAGAIVIWGHYTSSGRYLGGHTGIIESCDEANFYAYEGNTTGGLGATDKVVRDGGGCYRTKRSLKGDGNMKVRGFIKPF